MGLDFDQVFLHHHKEVSSSDLLSVLDPDLFSDSDSDSEELLSFDNQW